ncbi:heterokaryon incompatibility protein-domain-containing protein, partial [Microdochium bolleyi]
MDLGPSEQPSRTARLRPSESLQSTTEAPIQYAALSYCWGPPDDAAKQFKTTRANLSERQAAIVVSETSPVIQDAVKVCKALGVRYLWVDAVCIIQDETRDWHREASRMRDVYGSASVTICALASSSCTQRFLTEREAGFKVPFTSRVKEGVHGHLTLRCGTQPEHDYALDNLPILEDFDTTWFTRAWTSQEHHLSQKLLMFCKERLYICSESGTRGEAESFSENIIATPFVATLEDAASREPLQLDNPLNREWMDLVTGYSSRYLSDVSDRLPALSGLASFYQRLLREDDRYLAGTWSNDLHRQLFW